MNNPSAHTFQYTSRISIEQLNRYTEIFYAKLVFIGARIMPIPSKINNIVKHWLLPIVWVYFTGLYTWLSFYILTIDNFGVMALMNPFAVYLFFPLPVIFLLAYYLKRNEFWVGGGIASIVFLYFWGGLFIGQKLPNFNVEEPITVMTFNALGYNYDPTNTIEMILEVDADVVFLQELNWELAKQFRNKKEYYPYQILDPKDDVTGMGILSKYPLSPTGLKLDLMWVGEPIIVRMDYLGESIYLLNIHMVPGGIYFPSSVEKITSYRIEQAKVIHEFVTSSNIPVIVGGDVNDTPLSTPYKILTKNLEDAWSSAGFGFGHTFPGSDEPGSSRPKLGEWNVPQWLIRIDYIFYSSEIFAVNAYTSPYDGLSDHRGVVAELVIDIDH